MLKLLIWMFYRDRHHYFHAYLAVKQAGTHNFHLKPRVCLMFINYVLLYYTNYFCSDILFNFLFALIRIVESVGEGVTDLKPGDHVLPVFTGECKECQHCKSEESNMCDLLRINTDREWCSVMTNQGFQLMDSQYTILLEPPHSVNTLWFMLAVLQKSTLLPLLTKFVCGMSTG